MIGYVMVGTNNLLAATRFYDSVLESIDLVRVDAEDNLAAYAPKLAPHKIEFYVCKPFNQNRASFGNGTMIAFSVNSTESVDQFHKIGLENGGKNEGYPGNRPTENDPYYAYLRDIDGNKICAYFSN